MSAIDPLILNEVVTAEPVGKTLTSLGSPGSKYLPCDGLTRNSTDWPELATLLANTGTAAGTLSTTTVDISNSRPTVTVLSATANLAPLVGNNGRVFFQIGNSLRVVTDGVLTTTVTLPSSEQLSTMVAYGNILIAHGATRLHRSLDNGLTWFTFSNTLVLSHTTIRGSNQVFDYDPTSDTLIVGNGSASGSVFRCTNLSTATPTLVSLGANPATLTTSSSQIEYRCVFYDTATTTWYAGGGLQVTAAATDWRHFVIQSTNQGATWTVRFQDSFTSETASRRITGITKASNGEIVAIGNLNGRLFHLGSSTTTQAYYFYSSVPQGMFSLGEKGFVYDTTYISELTPPSTPTTWGNVWGRGPRVLAVTGGSVYSAGTSAHGYASGVNITSFFATTINPTGWSQIVFGTDHAIGIRSDGTLWAWGNNTNSCHGDGTTVAKTLPTQIGTDTNWAFAAAGSTFSLAVKTDGTLWGTGINTSGQLGDGTVVTKTTWTRIGTATNWLRVYAGFAQSWGITTTNQLWAWGGNDGTDTMLGLGSTALGAVTSPTQVTNPSLSWASVHPGAPTVDIGTSVYALALTTTGELYYWGRNSGGYAGSGTLTSTPTPTRIGTSTWTKIAADNAANLGIRSDGTLWTWGSNGTGYPLGLGTTTNATSPTQLSAQTNWTEVFSTYGGGLALNSSGQLYGWGSGYTGLGATSPIPSPEAVGFLPTPARQAYAFNANRVWQVVDNEVQSSIPGAFASANNTENSILRRYDGTTPSASIIKLGWLTGTSVAPISGGTRRLYANRHGLVWYMPDATDPESVSQVDIQATTSTTAGAFVNYVTRDATHTYAVIGTSDIWKTSDGITWTKAGTNPFASNSASNLVEAPVFWNNEWWVISGTAVYKSPDLLKWEFVSNTPQANLRLFPGTTRMLALYHTATSPTVYSTLDGITWTGFSNPYSSAGIVSSVAYNGSIFYVATASGVFSVNDATNVATAISNTNLPEVGNQQVAFGNSKLVLASSRHIVQSSDAFSTVEDTSINSRNLGMFTYTPTYPLSGYIQTRAGIYALPASATGDILVSSDGLNFTRLTKPAAITTFAWASMFISHSGIVVVVDNANNRIYRTIASDTSTNTFVVPRSVTSEGFQNYVRAKR